MPVVHFVRKDHFVCNCAASVVSFRLLLNIIGLRYHACLIYLLYVFIALYTAVSSRCAVLLEGTY